MKTKTKTKTKTKPTTPEAHVWCGVCGSTNVDMAMWVNPNTREIGDDFGSFNESDAVFCNDCEARCLVIEKPTKKQLRENKKEWDRTEGLGW